MLYESIGRSSYLFGRFNLKACNVCKALMRGSHALLVYVKAIKNVGGPIYEMIPIELFVDMKNLKKIVKIAHKTILEILILLNVYI